MWPFKKKTDKPNATHANPYMDLRNMALAAKPIDIKLDVRPDEPFGILMEMGVQRGSATILSMKDGSMSLYFSGGGGILGAQGRPTVREAGNQFLNAAQYFTEHMTPTTTFPLPGPNRVRFYVLTSEAVLTYEAFVEDLGYNRDPVSPLFHAGDRMLTQLRLTSEERDKRNKAAGG